MGSIAELGRIKSLERDVKSLSDAVRQLSERLEALEAKRGPGRPRVEDAGRREATTGH